MMNEGLIILIVALAIDLILGEPWEPLHPVRWMGFFIDSLKKLGQSRLYGTLLAVGVISLSISLTATLLFIAFRLSDLFGLIFAAYLLKSTFSITMLIDTARKILWSIQEDQTDARLKLRALVGRGTKNLNKGEMRSAVIESLSENFLDGILSPLFYFIIGLPWGIVGGIASAMAYKSVNTLDSMVGYKTSELKDIGYFSANLDDILNFLPARLSLPIISIASCSANALHLGLREHDSPSSPNAGWPMATMAGALKVKLRKPGYYSLGRGYSLPQEDHVKKGIKIIKVSIGITLLLAGGVIWII